MLAAFQQAIDATYAAIGVTVTYTFAAGGTQEVTVIPRRPDQQVSGFTDTTLQTQAATFEVRAAEVPQPAAGDTVTLDGITYTVQGAPRRDDPRRLVWQLDTRPS